MSLGLGASRHAVNVPTALTVSDYILRSEVGQVEVSESLFQNLQRTPFSPFWLEFFNESVY